MSALSTEILINCSPAETRLALIENGVLQELHFESATATASRQAHSNLVGNVYKGRVQRVLPGMQAAFVDIGLERTAFLHASDMIGFTRRIIRAESADSGNESSGDDPVPIEAQLHEGATVVVQVLKNPMGQKGARLTTQLSIPSRYLVLLPDREAVGISTRISDEEERSRLKRLVAHANESLPGPAGNQDDAPDSNAVNGFIVRTLAEGIDADAMESDMRYLHKRWRSLLQDIASSEPGDCIYEDLSLPLRAIRDWVGPGVERIRVDDRSIAASMTGFAQEFVPEAEAIIEYYSGDGALFERYAVEDEIQRAFESTVDLKSGGSIVIESTEALTVIDVNTGGYVGRRNLEETIYRTNLEAAQAIGRQLRLRNLGGIIVVDFIDMQDSAHQENVLAALDKALARDPARTTFSGFSALGLVELTRKRTTESLTQRLGRACPACSGRGIVKNRAALWSEILRELTRSRRQFETPGLRVMAHPELVEWLVEDQADVVADLESRLGATIAFQSDAGYAIDQFDVVVL